MTGGYRPEWDVDKARGEEAEALFRKMRTGLVAGTTEVKRDDRARDTGNFYVELECRRIDGWHPSGLATTKATAWAFVSWPIVVAVPVWVLKLAVAGARPAECTVGSHPTRGVVVPMGELLNRAVAVANAPIGHAA